MTGLRDRKKMEIRHRVIQAAGELFADQGLDDTTMDEIAAAADVSVGTVYNYFGSKNALLLAGVAEDTDAMLDQGGTVLDDPGTDPVAAVQRLFGFYLNLLTEWDPRLLREVMSAAFQRSGGEELTIELAQMDQRLIDQMVTLLSHFHTTKKLRPDVEVYEATMLLFSAFATQLFMFISIEGLTASDLHAQVNRQVELAFTGLGSTSKRKAKKS